MLEWAGLGVAMSHARPAARSAAKMVAPDGDPETSFARAVAGVLKASLGATGSGTSKSKGRRQEPAAVGHAAARWSPPPLLPL